MKVASAHSNFVVILTDDQDVALNGLNPMENVRKLLANRGALFTNVVSSILLFGMVYVRKIASEG